MAAFYNEIDSFAAAWLRELIKAGHIAAGEVCEQDIKDIRPADLDGFTQCHFFAGIGVWSYALRLAGWPDDRAVWTGSCPCQPFSAAGRAGGFADERHLWPAFFHLIEERRPSVVFGEQVASKDGLAWLDLVQADMEGADYAIGALDLCAAGVGAPHIRQRLYFGACAVGDASVPRLETRNNVARVPQGPRGTDTREAAVGTGLHASGLADTQGERRRVESRHILSTPGTRESEVAGQGDGNAACTDRAAREPGPTNSIWRDADWLYCRDGKWRPVRPGSFPLAHGAPARVGRLRGYGNAIVAQAAAEFIAAYSGA